MKSQTKNGKKPLEQHLLNHSQHFSTSGKEHGFQHGASLPLTCRCCLWQCHAAAHTWMVDFSCQALHLEWTPNARWLHWSWCHYHLLRTQSTEINTIWNSFFPPRWDQYLSSGFKTACFTAQSWAEELWKCTCRHWLCKILLHLTIPK